jgi:alanine racemase
MRAAWLEIDLAAFRQNLRSLAQHTSRPVLAVVKANGYGHGLHMVAPAALEAGCPGVAVALPEEGAELREAGQGGRILVMGLALEEQAGLIAAHDLDALVTRPEMLRAFSEAGGTADRRVRIHVKVDSGMTRAGVEPEEALGLCELAAADPHLELAGVMTHFAAADVPELPTTEQQWRRFEPVVRVVRERWPQTLVHAANSPAGLWYPETYLDWIRGGLIIYGCPPGRPPLPFPVTPVASLRAKVVQVREVPAGRAISYGGTWIAPRPSRLALVPVGYGDGLPRSLSNVGSGLIGGLRAPIRGRVCMDQLILDVTDLPPVTPGDVVTFLGREGDAEITAQELADLAGTITHEVFTRFTARLPRVVVDAPAGQADAPAG